MQNAVKIAIVEALIIIILAVILLWPTEKVDTSEYEALKESVSKAISERDAIKSANAKVINKLRSERDGLQAKLNQGEEDKIENNENLQIDLRIIRNSPLDKLVITVYERPKSY